jgi:hypothetical protein
MRKSFPYPIYKLGIELEGGFLTSRRLKAQFHEDSSVHISRDDVYNQLGKRCRINDYYNETYDPYYDCPNRGDVSDCNCECCEYHRGDSGTVITGEYISEPLTTWKDFITFVDTTHPDVVNDSCGTHIHTSMRNMVYMSAMLENADTIYDRMCSTLEKWGNRVLPANDKQWLRARVRGKNSFCKPKHNVAFLHPHTNGWRSDTDRYQCLNFRSLEEHGTLENRVLPGFTKAQYLKEASHIILTVYNKVLRDALKNKVMVTLNVQSPLEGSLVPVPNPDVKFLRGIGCDDWQRMLDAYQDSPYINDDLYPEKQEVSRIGSQYLNKGRHLKSVAKAAITKGKKTNKKRGRGPRQPQDQPNLFGSIPVIDPGYTYGIDY